MINLLMRPDGVKVSESIYRNVYSEKQHLFLRLELIKQEFHQFKTAQCIQFLQTYTLKRQLLLKCVENKLHRK